MAGGMSATMVQESPASLREKLRSAFARLKLPTSPALATKILSLADDPTTTIDQFAQVIQLDAALAGRLLRMANSVELGQRQAVTTIAKAVRTLGINRVRTVALGFQLVGHLNKLGGCAFDIKTYWQHSLLRGCLARQIAQRILPGQQEEAFLIGLLQECGVLLLVQILKEPYARLYDPGTVSPAAFYKIEKEHFNCSHIDACAAIAAEWRLPETIATPLARHHTPTTLGPENTDLDRLSAISYFVGSIRFISDETADPAETSLRTYAREQLGLGDADLADMFDQAARTYAQTSHVLGDTIPDDLDVAELLGEANRQLMAAAGEAEAKVGTIAAERDEVRRQQEQLRSALGEYRERAARDPLTGVLNRGALCETAGRMIDVARLDGTSVAAIFLDVDNFKKLNDTYGHAVGDEVLRALAVAVSQVATNAGCLGRYGGEEFVLVIPGLTHQQAEDAARRVVQLARSIDYRKLGLDSPVTCSVGAVCGQGAALPHAEALLASADEQMYLAKKGGKDRSFFKPLDPAPLKSSESARIQPPVAAGRPGAVPAKLSNAASAFRSLGERLNRAAAKRFVSARKEIRKDLMTPCLLYVLRRPSLTVDQHDAFARNISTSGMSLLAPRYLARGEAVEVALRGAGPASLHVAGLVAFCRHVEGDIHEIGIQFTARANEPIFAGDPPNAIKKFTWLASAIQGAGGQPAAGPAPSHSDRG